MKVEDLSETMKDSISYFSIKYLKNIRQKSNTSTHGSASKAGKAVSCIFDGAVYPILYIPTRSSFFLSEKDTRKSVRLPRRLHTIFILKLHLYIIMFMAKNSLQDC